MPMMFPIQTKMFQSTYLYKVRLLGSGTGGASLLFQSTYLYKVRPGVEVVKAALHGFNPRTYIRYDRTCIGV